MVALLEVSKNNVNEEFSTNMMSEPPDMALSAFEAASQQLRTPDIQEIAQGSKVEAVQTVED